MSIQLPAWKPIDRGLLQLILTYDGMPVDPAAALDRVGGNFDHDPTLPWYIRIERIFSRAGQLQGTFTFDVEVFAPASTVDAESVSDDLEALLLGYPHVVEVDDETLVFDSVFQNVGRRELPWEDESVTRLGATYVITARRR